MSPTRHDRDIVVDALERAAAEGRPNWVGAPSDSYGPGVCACVVAAEALGIQIQYWRTTTIVRPSALYQALGQRGFSSSDIYAANDGHIAERPGPGCSDNFLRAAKEIASWPVVEDVL